MLIYRFNTVPIKSCKAFVDIDELFLKFVWEGTNTGRVKTIFIKETKELAIIQL